MEKLKKLRTAKQEEIDAIDKWRSEIAACYSNSHARYTDLPTSDTTPKDKKPKATSKPKVKLSAMDDSEMADES